MLPPEQAGRQQANIQHKGASDDEQQRHAREKVSSQLQFSEAKFHERKANARYATLVTYLPKASIDRELEAIVPNDDR